MRTIRIIPVLLLHDGQLVKSAKFGKYKYVGDPINAVRIFNEKEVDELCILDIDPSRKGTAPNIAAIADIVSEAFMPVSYGGGVSTLQHAEALFYNGVEKVILNHAVVRTPKLITEIASVYGSQSVVASIDYKKNWLGKIQAYTLNGTVKASASPLELLQEAQDRGAGEILLNNIDRDGTFEGYDLEMIRKAREVSRVPLIACGGAGSIDDFAPAIAAGADALAAGSLFVFQGVHRAVLINYPERSKLRNIVSSRR